MRTATIATLAMCGAWLLAAPARAAEPAGKDEDDQSGADEKQLAKAVQNPVADLISLPFQNNTTYNIGPNDRAANTLNIQPVVPIHVSTDILMIARIIVPIAYQPDLGRVGGGSSGLGDTNPTFFFSPANFKIGKVPLNGTLQAYYNLRADNATQIGSWQARLQIAFLFPTGKAKPAAAVSGAN
ncbi:MAG TPA: hypothetical protein VHG72_05745 [Polyangia bacterium]|nr:hypothetical protein [Polyangia bacterium]